MNKKTIVEYKNDFNRQKYDRIGLMIPKGMGEIWKSEAQKNDMSLNAFVQTAVNLYISQGKETSHEDKDTETE